MNDLIETIKSSPKTHKNIELFNNEISNESYETHSRKIQIALIQTRNFENDFVIMGETIADMAKKMIFKRKY